MNPRKLLQITLILLISTTLWAEEENSGFNLSEFYVETRLAGQGNWQDGHTKDKDCGFKGQYINLRLDGQITKGLTYSYRQRLNKNSDQTFWDATDWLHLDWQINNRWSLSAGKQVYGVGGYEYDQAPIDLYYCSEFWNNIPCYQLGVAGSYKPTQNDKLLLQVANTPFRKWAGNNRYGFNLLWYGKHGFWETIWSVNMIQICNHRWMNYLALGNRFNICPQVHLDVDIMNRASTHQAFLFRDYSIMSELSVQPCPSTRCWIGYTHDSNKAGTDADYMVKDGTCLNQFSLGTEINPLKKYREALRAFAVVGYCWGENSNEDGTLQDRQLRVQAGIKFRLDILQGFKAIMNKTRTNNTTI